jgi:hypothetical protein
MCLQLRYVGLLPCRSSSPGAQPLTKKDSDMPSIKNDLKAIRRDADKITKAALAELKKTGRRIGSEPSELVLLLVANRLLSITTNAPAHRAGAKLRKKTAKMR